MNKFSKTVADRVELDELSDLEAVDKLIDVNGLDLIEAGCAAGNAARGLADMLGLRHD